MEYLEYNNYQQDGRAKTEYISESSINSSTSGQLLELYSSRSSANGSTSSQLLELYSKVFSELQDTVNTWAEELFEEVKLISGSHQASNEDKQQAEKELRRRLDNYSGSWYSVQKFLSLYKEKMKSNFLPAIAIDGDGEVVFEWYGRLGARAILTFGGNGAVYFVALFHGEVFKYQLFLTNSIPKEIGAQLEKIFKDRLL